MEKEEEDRAYQLVCDCITLIGAILVPNIL